MTSRPGLRLACIAVAMLYFIAGAALFAKMPAVTSLWPWPASGMAYVFLASIAVAVGAPVLWIGITREFAALAAIGLNALVATAGMAIYLVVQAVRGESGLAPAIVVMSVHALGGALLFLRARRIPVLDQRPLPAIVRWAFAGFTVLLLTTGTALVLQIPRIFPWNLPPHSSTVFGFIFLGAAVYFLYGFVRPRWAFGAGQLWGFLAYDIVLFVPYGRMLFGDSAGSGYDDYGGYGAGVNVPSLTVYLTVLTLSTALALYMFVIHPETRIGRRREGSMRGPE